MGSIKLEYNKQHIIINKIINYQIYNINQWDFLTKFTKAYLIIYYPTGYIETVITRKFVYNQKFELINDLDFEYKPILPLGNYTSILNIYPSDISPFTGSFNGNNFKISNINLINTNNNGLFGIIKSGFIKNLILQNILINDGINNCALVSRAYDITINNIQIIGNICINGLNGACLSNYLKGNINNIHICVDGLIESNKKALICNKLIGNIDTINVISNIINSPGLINTINGQIKCCSLISFSTLPTPFYEESINHLINNCYYFQINNDLLPPIQKLESCYYRNLNNEIIWSTDLNILDLQNWNKINCYYYLKNNINYSNESLCESQNIQFYDLINEFNNINNNVFIKKNQIFSIPNILVFNITSKLINEYYESNSESYDSEEYTILKISNEKILRVSELILKELNNI
jgi:hypothetical protein